MGSHDNAFKAKMDQHMEEMRRLHDGVLRAADRVEHAADRAEKSTEKLEAWVHSISKDVSRLKHWRTAMLTGGALLSFLLKEKAMAVLGLGKG